MKRTVIAIAVAMLSLLTVAGIAQAAPAAPLASSVTADHGNLTQVRLHHHHCWFHHGHRHCHWW